MSTATLPELPGGRYEMAPAAGYIPPGGEAEGMGFQDVMRILRQRRLTIVITTIIAYILVCGATYIVWKYFPAYVSEALFQLDPPKRMDPLDKTIVEVNPDYMQQMLQTEASKLRGAGLLLQVAGVPELKPTRYYSWYEQNAEKCAEGLRKDLVIAPIPDTQLIRVMLATRDAEESKLIVGKLSNQYLQTYTTESQTDLFRTAESLKKMLSDANSDLEKKRSDLATHRQTSDAPSLESQRMMSAELIAKLNLEITQSQALLRAVEAKLESISGIDPSKLPLTAEQQLIVESDPILRYLRNTVEGIDVQIRAVKLQYGENHRVLQQLEEQRLGYFEKEVARREELSLQVRMRQVESLNDERRQRESGVLQMVSNLREAEARQRDLDKQIQKSMQMDQDIEMVQKGIEKIDADYKVAQSAAADQTRVRLRLVQNATRAVKPSRPDPYLYLGGGAAIALLAGVGLAFLREFTDKRIRTPIDVARFGHLSVLGSVPLLDDETAEIDDIEEAVRAAPHSIIAESFRKIRTNLQFSAPRESQRTLLVTSPSPGDGKTSVAINLAVSSAHGSQRVLLIDCNFRKPGIRERFEGTRPDGLSNVLTNQGKLEDLITPTSLPSLFVLTTGPMPPRPAELLGSQKMRELLTQLTQGEIVVNGKPLRFDLVILDGPPALLISDAMVLAMQVDGVIVVTRADTNAKGALKRAREQLEAVNARIVGAVLNGVRARAGGYYKQQYRDFYEYTSDETVPSDLPGLPGAGETDKKG